jgi:DNA (cytosine-5)-methyltransferase 1
VKLGTYSIKEIERRQKTPTAISLFSGCGGAALGLMQAGFDVRVFVEHDKYACQTLRRNWTDELGPRTIPEKNQKYQGVPAILQRDITTLPTKEILEAARLSVGEAMTLEGGFPCQGFSTANNNRQIDDPRNALYRECVRVIKEALPQTFMLENVPGLVSMANGEIMLQIMQDLASVGYDLTWDILDAADYGVPQRRRRVIFIGKRVDIMTFDANGQKNPGLHMGAAVGQLSVPKWYLDKYVRKSEKVKAFAALPRQPFYMQSGGKEHMIFGRECATLIQ